jgi:hypothetical protein
MANETAAISKIRALDDPVGPASPAGPLNDDEMKAAGWLSEALSAPEPGLAGSQALQPKSINGVATMGDAILRGLSRVSDSYMKTAGELHTTIEDGGTGKPSLMGALRMHMSFVEVSLQADIVSKGISKSEQSIEQLVKQQ